ncbi:nucleotidyltransferase [Promicromonospora iranensis]|uniref:Nucleotidyltransferase n=1 Tax=Promicromonospora iranensis TaxID=1105144 RepID=A0ABU2CK60_9MICO|nr:nucleotidyltransferase [Promicromonospora iranensis]MDR7381727.1 putative nucleotidyltransferase [Promicromonospora iranensis]
MIRDAIKAHGPFQGMSSLVYAKGSYANNTNVRADSDVDIAVECTEATYWGEQTPGAHPPLGKYTGEWTPTKLRRELVAALKAKLGDDVDTSSTTAIQVHSSAARVEADVVPCFRYKHYLSATNYREGAKVFRTDGTEVINYSALQLAKGRAKNNNTNGAFKKTVRILKRLENVMVEGGYHREVPSFLVECLVYNCPDDHFGRSSWTSVVKGVLGHIYVSLASEAEPINQGKRWLEVSEAKYLFADGKKWTRKDARDFAYAGWNYLGLGKV